MCKRVLQLNGRFVLMNGNAPIRGLSDSEVKIVQYQRTARYKVRQANDMELLDLALTSLYRGNADDAAIYKTEVLYRMSNNK